MLKIQDKDIILCRGPIKLQNMLTENRLIAIEVNHLEDKLEKFKREVLACTKCSISGESVFELRKQRQSSKYRKQLRLCQPSEVDQTVNTTRFYFIVRLY